MLKSDKRLFIFLGTHPCVQDDTFTSYTLLPQSTNTQFVIKKNNKILQDKNAFRAKDIPNKHNNVLVCTKYKKR